MFFYVVMTVVILQRLLELVIAKRNENYLRKRGAYEVGQTHYPFIVLLHVSFFLSLISEVLLFERQLAPWFALPFFLFIVLQVGRVWSIYSLGRFWNTKIIVLPHAEVVKRGPYKYMRHPNYAIVTLEIFLLPIMFQAYLTALVFTILNIGLLSVRIKVEERSLSEATNYGEAFFTKN